MVHNHAAAHRRMPLLALLALVLAGCGDTPVVGCELDRTRYTATATGLHDAVAQFVPFGGLERRTYAPLPGISVTGLDWPAGLEGAQVAQLAMTVAPPAMHADTPLPDYTQGSATVREDAQMVLDARPHATAAPPMFRAALAQLGGLSAAQADAVIAALPPVPTIPTGPQPPTTVPATATAGQRWPVTVPIASPVVLPEALRPPWVKGAAEAGYRQVVAGHLSMVVEMPYLELRRTTGNATLAVQVDVQDEATAWGFVPAGSGIDAHALLNATLAATGWTGTADWTSTHDLWSNEGPSLAACYTDIRHHGARGVITRD